MLKKMLALFLGMLLLFSFALAEAPAAAETETADQESIMIPRQFMSMFDTVFELYANQYFSEEAEQLVNDYSLTQYDFRGIRMYYGSVDWKIETGFEFESEEVVSPDTPCISWYLYLSDAADINAWYLAMYSLNQMITYKYQDKADDILNYFQTVAPGDILELPDGYSLITYRTEDDDGVIFEMYSSVDSASAAGEK